MARRRKPKFKKVEALKVRPEPFWFVAGFANDKPKTRN
jgi:hypothetical protein